MWLACRRGSRGCKGKAKPGGLEFSQGCSAPGENFLRPLQPQAVPGEPARVQGEPLEVSKVQGGIGCLGLWLTAIVFHLLFRYRKEAALEERQADLPRKRADAGRLKLAVEVANDAVGARTGHPERIHHMLRAHHSLLCHDSPFPSLLFICGASSLFGFQGTYNAFLRCFSYYNVFLRLYTTDFFDILSPQTAIVDSTRCERMSRGGVALCL